MKRYICTLFCVLNGVFCQRGAVRAADAVPGLRDPGGAVLAVFALKCASCHGPDVARPRGRFGYVLDLARVAGNPEMVVPFRPSESELWELVRHDEMPPPDAPHGGLTAAEKEVIRAWIAAGAPPPAAPPSRNLPPTATPPAAPPSGPTASPPVRLFLSWIGKLHLILLHFPIALLAAAAAGECWSVVRPSQDVGPAVRFCILLGAVSALVTVPLGWLHALGGYGAAMPETLTLHRWLGTAAALAVVVTALLSERDARRGARSPLTRVLLFASAVLIAVVGHTGGSLVHGADFLAW